MHKIEKGQQFRIEVKSQLSDDRIAPQMSFFLQMHRVDTSIIPFGTHVRPDHSRSLLSITPGCIYRVHSDIRNIKKWDFLCRSWKASIWNDIDQHSLKLTSSVRNDKDTNKNLLWLKWWIGRGGKKEDNFKSKDGYLKRCTGEKCRQKTRLI